MEVFAHDEEPVEERSWFDIMVDGVTKYLFSGSEEASENAKAAKREANQYRVETVWLPFNNEAHWDLVNEQLGRRINTCAELSAVLIAMKPNIPSLVQGEWSLTGLQNLIIEDEIDFFGQLLPFIQSLALVLPSLFPRPLPCLIGKEPLGGHYAMSAQQSSVSLSKFQIASLLANLFFCTYGLESDFHLALVLSSQSRNQYAEEQKSKMRCILNYFMQLGRASGFNVQQLRKAEHLSMSEHVSHSESEHVYEAGSDSMTKETVRSEVDGNTNQASSTSNGASTTRLSSLRDTAHQMVHFRRNVLSREDFPKWSASNYPLCPLVVKHIPGKIDDPSDASIVDFANPILGGGTLQMGYALEEILFVTHPECLVSLLLVQSQMALNDAIVISNVAKFSNYSGYMRTFKYVGEVREEVHAMRRDIVCIDAMPFQMDPEDQFQAHHVQRELVKCYCGFMGTDRPVSTGNWGCGAFGGDVYLKSLLQWIAASQANRSSVNYYVFEKEEFGNKLARLVQFIETKRSTDREIGTVSWLWRGVIGYCMQRNPQDPTQLNIFDHLATKCC